MIKPIIDAIASDQSRKAKEHILTQHRENQTLQRVFSLAYNPYVQFYIKQIPEYPHGNPDLTLDTALHQLDRLADRTYTGHRAVDFLADLLSRLMPDDAVILSRVIQRDLACGVSEATINKIWPDLVPTYPCLLASSDDAKTRAKIRFPAIAQEKCDGMRVNAIVENGVVSYRSRNGKVVDCHSVELDTAVKTWRSLFGEDCVIDGELLCWQRGTNAPLERKIGNGICNKAIKGTVSDRERDLFVMIAWDVIPLSDFKRGKHTVGYSERFDRVHEIHKTAYSSRVIPVNSRVVTSWQEASLYYADMIKAGKEGLIIKNAIGIWEDKRSPDLVKMKEVNSCELRVVGIEAGTGKYNGMMGALICESDGSNPIKVNIGSGFSDEQRKHFNTASIVGRIVTVEYNEVIAANDGSRSLFLPRFVELREDKSTADVF